MFGGGYIGSGESQSNTNVLQYITIASTGNTTDFGDRTVSLRAISATSNSIRGVFAGGRSGTSDVIDYITIASTGDAADFGDLTEVCAANAGLSDSHGGLQ